METRLRPTCRVAAIAAALTAAAELAGAATVVAGMAAVESPHD
eukprot:CAMPEP_0181179210 /NCGR_PEP_ID=MMETSP1096-20121128/6137_1 /TAXON_ID=156174 ORGANISM="Chrysochromulina ericina, Strain CCMP281" /NCGR_SAMPLE_ID=MMETSP1096 /ASSEMBLY_ACC=CAM_ASM_000453 /LENGTH=42 /DNA_ID= /DNA_START= /DNA_END= /DNA_ORIENTATION=